MTRKMIVSILIFIGTSFGFWFGFMEGVKSEKEDIVKRSVPMGSCTLVFQ